MTDFITGFRERVNMILEARDLTKTEVARKSGITPQILSNWLNAPRTKNVYASEAAKLARGLGVDVGWLITGKSDQEVESAQMDEGFMYAHRPPYNCGIVPPGYVEIKEYKFPMVINPGELPQPVEVEDGARAIYRADFFQRQQRDPADCMRFKVSGDSMRPVIFDSDVICVDCSERARRFIRNGHVYAIYSDGELDCKYLFQRWSDRTLIIRSANPAYAEEQIPREKLIDLQFFIIGEVFERSGRIRRYSQAGGGDM